MLYGARTSPLVGLTAAIAPRWLDGLIARTADILLALPLLVVVLALAAVAGGRDQYGESASQCHLSSFSRLR